MAPAISQDILDALTRVKMPGPVRASEPTESIEIGGLKRTDTANIMLGMALFNQKRLEQARRAFQRAMSDNRSKRTATQWIAYVDSEIKRRDLMRQELPDFEPRERDELLDVIEGKAEGE